MLGMPSKMEFELHCKVGQKILIKATYGRESFGRIEAINNDGVVIHDNDGKFIYWLWDEIKEVGL